MYDTNSNDLVDLPDEIRRGLRGRRGLYGLRGLLGLRALPCRECYRDNL